MLVIYNEVAVNAHLACGLLEDVKVTNDQKKQLSIIVDLIDGLKADFDKFCAKHKVKGVRELIGKSKKDKALEKEIKNWMASVYERKNTTIKEIVNEFNAQYNESYAKYATNKPTL